MQHVLHIFVGKEQEDLKNNFEKFFKSSNPDIDKSFFTAVTLVEDGRDVIFKADETGDLNPDNASFEKDKFETSLLNYFEDLYTRKVTIATSGNHSMVVCLWVRLFTPGIAEKIAPIVEVLRKSSFKFKVEVAGFTHDAVACFIPDFSKRESPAVYRKEFDQNVSALLPRRNEFVAVRLIANKNIDNVALNFTEVQLARVCAEFATLQVKHYLDINKSVYSSEETPFETFGLSSLVFDLEYYKTYLRYRLIVDKLKQEEVGNHVYNINALAKVTNPIVAEILQDVQSFYSTQARLAEARLQTGGSSSNSDIVGEIDTQIKEIIGKLKNKVDDALDNDQISIYEKEALMALILGNDSTLFDTSAVNAEEKIIDDIIDVSADYFVKLEGEGGKLEEVSQEEIKNLRTKIRNISYANRNCEERLNTLQDQLKENKKISAHIHGTEYQFGDNSYKVNLKIDKEPLAENYEPHPVNRDSLDLRKLFGPIRDQGDQGSCASFAITSVMEILAGKQKRYSPAFVYWMARQKRNASDKDTGASLYEIIRTATEDGVCEEEKMPYNVKLFSTAPSEIATEEAKKCRIVIAKTVVPSIDDIKSALSDGFPVIIASQIFESFTQTNAGFVSHPSKEEKDRQLNPENQHLHAMVVCGFSDKEKIFVVRNSWGTVFGDDGYCYIPYSYAKQYFKQACIITELTAHHSGAKTMPVAVNFNTSDSNIEAAILQNLIEENNFELNQLKGEYDRLRTRWTQNVNTLINANKQAAILDDTKADIGKEITASQQRLNDLQNSKNEKIKNFKKEYIKSIVSTGVLVLISIVFVILFYNHYWSWIVFGVLTLIFIALICKYAYSWRKYRQELRDEIQAQAMEIDRLRKYHDSIDIKGHIHGTILKEAQAFKSEMVSAYQKRQAFNNALTEIYDWSEKWLESATPEVPYPFLPVLSNDRLDSYYSIWSAKLVKSMDLNGLFANYRFGADLFATIKKDVEIERRIMKGLEGFSLKEYVVSKNSTDRVFLPGSRTASQTIPSLDERAKPFAPYMSETYQPFEKYLFVSDLDPQEFSYFTPHFNQAPMQVNTDSPYKITVLNINRYHVQK